MRPLPTVVGPPAPAGSTPRFAAEIEHDEFIHDELTRIERMSSDAHPDRTALLRALRLLALDDGQSLFAVPDARDPRICAGLPAMASGRVQNN